MKKFSKNKKKKYNFGIITIMIVGMLAHIAGGIYKTTEAKEKLSFNQNDILGISINNTKETLVEDYKISPQTIKEINTEFIDKNKIVSNM